MQHIGTSISHGNISESAANEVRNMIVDGRLPAGTRINEVHLSRDLGVSRTPLREALARLEHEGAIDSVPRIGYFVRPLSVEEFQQVYAIRPLLDPEALRLAGLPDKAGLLNLKKLNLQMANATEPDEIIRIDDEFHLALIAGCPNKVLVDLIKHFSFRTRRYELALMRDHVNVKHTVADHEKILRDLRRGDLDGACLRLKENMFTGCEPIVRWLEKREPYMEKRP